MTLPAKLPQSQHLQVPEQKVIGYLLNPEHKDGASKSKFFRKRGFTPDQWAVFAKALQDHGATQPVTSMEETKHGKKFVVECNLDTPDGKNPCILSVWIQTKNDPPRLVTAHPNTA